MNHNEPAQLNISRLQAKVWDHYRRAARPMPWRSDPSPYHVIISEFMLQQTSVERVLPKYTAWVKRFPDFSTLASASVGEVVAAWKGLGYNRRALWLHTLAKRVESDFAGSLPKDGRTLQSFHGVGENTAGAVAAYAFEQPVVFVETNVRRVFLHHCFASEIGVTDAHIRPLVAQALVGQPARQWYWALMDYGAFLGRTIPNPNRRSRHYTRQSSFEGSHRQLRGQILEHVLQGTSTLSMLVRKLDNFAPKQIKHAVAELSQEGFLSCQDERVTMKTS